VLSYSHEKSLFLEVIINNKIKLLCFLLLMVAGCFGGEESMKKSVILVILKTQLRKN